MLYTSITMCSKAFTIQVRQGGSMNRLNRKGFTLIEVIVVAGITAILAGILVPLIFKEIDESKISRASADVRSISGAMIVLKKDTGQWPVMDSSCAANVTLLYSGADGTQPTNLAAAGFNVTTQSSYNDHLSTNSDNCYSLWKGPYMAYATVDPWGHSYVTNANGFVDSAKPPVWIISAGPNGQIDTAPVNNVVGADDVGIRLQ